MRLAELTLVALSPWVVALAFILGGSWPWYPLALGASLVYAVLCYRVLSESAARQARLLAKAIGGLDGGSGWRLVLGLRSLSGLAAVASSLPLLLATLSLAAPALLVAYYVYVSRACRAVGPAAGVAVEPENTLAFAVAVSTVVAAPLFYPRLRRAEACLEAATAWHAARPGGSQAPSS